MKEDINSAYELFYDGYYLEAYDKFSKCFDENNYALINENLLLCSQQYSKRHGRIINFDKLKISCVMDEFSFENFKYEAIVNQLSPENIRGQLEEYDPDMVFVESAWFGKNHLWENKIVNKNSIELVELTTLCNVKKIPCIFWNKEDPISYENFLSAATLFDFVFTTDIDCIPKYKAHLGHERVYWLPFACQPRKQNPIESPRTRKKGFCFAGSFYYKFPERNKDFENICDSIKNYFPLIIYDRNLGNNSKWNKFPDKYLENIKGNLDYKHINIAYKGYEGAINLNSVKNSQIMFARRIFELLASNTLIISNYSKGIKNVFGDLIFASDEGKEIINLLSMKDNISLEKIKLMGLRKVLKEHTYRNRLNYIIKKIFGIKRGTHNSKIICITFVRDLNETANVIDNFNRQVYLNKSLMIVMLEDFEGYEDFEKSESIKFYKYKYIYQNNLIQIFGNFDWMTFFHPEDWYGKDYLGDLEMTSIYSDQKIIGKEQIWIYDNTKFINSNKKRSYKNDSKLSFRSSIINYTEVSKLGSFHDFFNSIKGNITISGLSIDSFNYCKNGMLAKKNCNFLETFTDFDMGFPINEINKNVEKIRCGKKIGKDNKLHLGKGIFYNKFTNKSTKGLVLENEPYFISVKSDASKEFPAILQSENILLENYTRKGFLFSHMISFGLKTLKYTIKFLDKDKKLISKHECSPNLNCTFKIFDNMKYFNISITVREKNNGVIYGIDFFKHENELGYFISNNKYIIISDHYPSYDDLYQYAFLHSRIKSYKEYGINVDLFLIKWGQLLEFSEFEGINIISGDPIYLRKILDMHNYERMIIHFLRPVMWKIANEFPKIEKIIWIHGAEIQPWYRRAFNYTTYSERLKALSDSKNRMDFWYEVLESDLPNTSLVFVSNYLYNEVMEDYNLSLANSKFNIIYNPIDTDIFKYNEKNPDQRYKILSVRPFSSNKYANDISVKCILKLSERIDFHKFDILLIGDGDLFDDTVAPLKRFPNITIIKRFLTHNEIAMLYGEYGIILNPTRWDSQGVSRDEGMSCGMVPITNAISAIPEFIDTNCAILAKPENFLEMAEGISSLVDNPEKFLYMSKAAATNVRINRSKNIIIKKELDLIINGVEEYNKKYNQIKIIQNKLNLEVENDNPEHDEYWFTADNKYLNSIVDIVTKEKEKKKNNYSNLLSENLTTTEVISIDRYKEISVIIPTFNSEKYLSRCLDSVINQKNINIEIIIYDDCSTDNTINIIDSYRNKYNNIKLIRSTIHNGQGKGRNISLAHAKGKFIVFCDSDDYFDNKNFFYRLYEIAIDNNYDIIITPHKIEKSGKIESKHLEEEELDGVVALNKFLMRAFHTHGSWAKLYKREIIKDSSFIDYGYSEDVIFSLKTLLNAKKVKVYPLSSYVYFIDNISSFRPIQYDTIHLYTSLRLLGEILNFWMEIVQNNTNVDILQFIRTWQKDHGIMINKIFLENKISKERINFINYQFIFLYQYIELLLPENISKKLSYSQGNCEIDENYKLYENYLNTLRHNFIKNSNLFQNKNGFTVLQFLKEKL